MQKNMKCGDRMDRKLIDMKTVLRKKYGKTADAMHLYKYESFNVYKLVLKMLHETRRIENIESPYHGEITAKHPKYRFDEVVGLYEIEGKTSHKEGIFYTSFPDSEHQVVCPKCKGVGAIYDQVCPVCQGARTLFRKRVLEQKFYFDTSEQWLMPLSLLRRLPERFIKPLSFNTNTAKHTIFEAFPSFEDVSAHVTFDASYLEKDLSSWLDDLKSQSTHVRSVEMILFETSIQAVSLLEKYEVREVFIQDFKKIIWFPEA